MSRDSKFGYGFLLAGIGLPYLMDKFLGIIPATITAVVCAIVGIGFLIAGHRHREDGDTRPRRITWKTATLTVVLLCLLVLGIVYRLLRREVAGDQPPAPRSYLAFDGDIRFPGINNRNFVVGDDLCFNQYYKALGPNPVDVTESARWLYIKPKYDPATQKEVIEDFKKILEAAHAQPRAEPSTMMPGEGRFLTAYAKNGTGHRKVTQRDLYHFRSGEEIAFVIAQITYKDNGVLHHLRRCEFLQPPAEPPGVWQFCIGFTQSD
jgi:hypothetical protein